MTEGRWTKFCVAIDFGKGLEFSLEPSKTQLLRREHGMKIFVSDGKFQGTAPFFSLWKTNQTPDRKKRKVFAFEVEYPFEERVKSLVELVLGSVSSESAHVVKNISTPFFVYDEENLIACYSVETSDTPLYGAVHLVPFEAIELEEWREEVAEFVSSTHSFGLTKERIIKNFEYATRDVNKPSRSHYHWAIYDGTEDEIMTLVGYIYLQPIPRWAKTYVGDNQGASARVLVGPSFRRKGIAKRALGLVCEATPDIRKYLLVDDKNRPATNLVSRYEKLRKFGQEGQTTTIFAMK